MSAIASVRTVRASSGKDSQTVTKPVSAFQASLDTFKSLTKDLTDFESEAALAALDTLVTAVSATDADVSAKDAAIKAATDALKGHKAERAEMVTRQRRAIRLALQQGYQGKTIAAHFSVAGGTVSNVKSALDIKAALVKANAPTVPSDDALVSRVAKAAKVTGGKAALLKAAKAGTLPEDGEQESPRTAAQTLKAIQAALTAVKHIARTTGDDSDAATVVEIKRLAAEIVAQAATIA
jgi:small-conductance mechanosensitive channel